MPAEDWLQVCRRCGRVSGWADPRWRCGCGGLFDLQGPAGDPLVRADSVVAVALPIGPARQPIMGKGQPGRGYDPAGPGSAGAVVQARVRLTDPVVQGPGGGGDDQRSRRPGRAARSWPTAAETPARRWRPTPAGPGWPPRCSSRRPPRPARVAAIEVFGARVVSGARRSGRSRRRRPGDRGADRGLVRQPRLPARLRARRQDPGLRAVGTAGGPAAGSGRRAGRQRHPGPRALAGLSGAGATVVISATCRPSSPCRPNAAPPWPAGARPARPPPPASPSPIRLGAGEARAAILASRGAVVTVAEERAGTGPPPAGAHGHAGGTDRRPPPGPPAFPPERLGTRPPWWS